MSKHNAEVHILTIDSPTIKMKRKIDDATLRHVLAIVLGGASEAAASPAAAMSMDNAAVTSGGAGRPLAIREYLDSQEATGNSDKIATIGDYITRVLGQQGFTREEVRSYFRKAHEALPANFARDFALCIRAGWIAEDPQAKGSYYVTNRGKEAVAQKFSAESTAKLAAVRRKVNKKGGKND